MFDRRRCRVGAVRERRNRGKTMGVFLVTFDLKNGSESSYERIYEWSHRIGGYRYFRFQDGTWGRLPSTTIVVPLDASTCVAARDEFRAALEKGGFNPTHIAVADGNRAVYSDVLQAWQVPDYAKERVPAYV